MCTCPQLQALQAQTGAGSFQDLAAFLQVPNIKGVQNLAITDIAAELARLQQLAAANRLGAADLREGTITVSNIGAIGGCYATPLVTAREVAIVALGRFAPLHPRGSSQTFRSAQMSCVGKESPAMTNRPFEAVLCSVCLQCCASTPPITVDVHDLRKDQCQSVAQHELAGLYKGFHAIAMPRMGIL